MSSGGADSADAVGNGDELEMSYERPTEDELAYYERAVREIAQGSLYQCMICTVEMDYTCKMFACPQCYRVFDYECVREWALKSTAKLADRTWKCPNCYYVNRKVPAPNRATCWCGKVVNPEANPIEPNSCGQTCNAKICVHRCSKTCHLGAHQECMRTVKKKCRCGKTEREILCNESRKRRNNNFQCDSICGSLLPCGIHRCKLKCHKGLCGECPEILNGANLRCYCGEHTLDSIRCSDVRISPNGQKSKDQEGNSWIGVFQCNDLRSVFYKCGYHSFVEKCQAPATPSHHKPCIYSPKQLKTCPCGKTELKKLSKPRAKCTDPVPTCGARCDKPLVCGKHICPFECHDGPCMDPCLQVESAKCECQQKSFLVPCKFQAPAKCHMKCESLMSCKRHRCMERCCPGRPMATQRKNVPFALRNSYDETQVEAEHICLKECNLMLACGKHRCSRVCHAGRCPPCLESDSNDLVCPCGKTVIPAPVPCGTKLPSCPHPCIKVINNKYPCGHNPMPHNCHPIEEPCPPCTAPVYKRCKCGKNDRVKTLCFQTEVSCGQVCRKPLDNCHHSCQKTCHAPGECQNTCKAVCNLKRINCGHKCRHVCHGKELCPDIPCKITVEISCKCGRRTVSVPCGATSTVDSAKISQKLACDEECEKFERLQQLKKAFNIPDGKEDGVEKFRALVNTATIFEELKLPFTEVVLSIYSKQNVWCRQIEDILNQFMRDKGRVSLHFKPMRMAQRNFIHELASAYSLYAESQDPEPKRSVYIKKTTNSSIPAFSLDECLPIYESFKKLQQERKKQLYEAQTSTKLINYTVKEEPHVKLARYNGFKISNISPGTTEADLERLFAKHLKPTLVQNPQYMLLSSKLAVVFPANYADTTENCERDMQALVGHFNFMCKESFLADSVELCDVGPLLESEKLGTPELA